MNINELREKGKAISNKEVSIENLFKIYDYADIINPIEKTDTKTKEFIDKIFEMCKKCEDSFK
jgi:hypothetical protein